MASRGPRSTLSSPDLSSPEVSMDRYDPFQDPVELSTLSPPPVDHGHSFESKHRSPSRSPDGIPRGRMLPDSYFGASKSGGQYAPLPARNHSPQPSFRSGRESVYTLNTLYQNKTMDADTQALVERRAGEIAQWHVFWTTPALIGSLFLAGLAAAIGHHFFYASLNGQPAKEQLKMVRYGTALAFFVKSTLVGTVIICNRQRIWRTFRTKAMTVNGIDGLFSATEDPTQFFLNWEMTKNGKLATFMAVCSWLIPIASVLSPAALTSELNNINLTTTCPGVATLNFSRESTFNFRKKNEWDGRGTSLNYYNSTDLAGNKTGYFDYYDQPSKNGRRLAFSAAYLKRALPRENARTSYCGMGWNCTYSLNFIGPGYKCEDMTNSNSTEAPFKTDRLAPIGNFTYLSDVYQNEYRWPQIDSQDGTPVQDPPYPASLGVLQSEPNLWIGYSIKKEEVYPSDSPYASRWKNVHESKIFNPTKWDATPSSNFLRPLEDREAYKLAAAYHSMGALLRMFLTGNIEKKSEQFIVTRSDISETRLINSTSSYPLPNLVEAIQNLFEDMLITLLSDPNLVVAQDADVPCVKSQSVVLFRYVKRALWIGYAVVISITLAFVLVGAWSIHQNGVASDVLFSRIMATTRNPTLDHISVGACLGGDPFPKELAETKLRFGVLLEDDPKEGPLGVVEHCCFGTTGETKEIVKGGTYAGLKKWREGNAETADASGETELLVSISDRS